MLRTMNESGRIFAIIPIEEYERFINMMENIDEDEADIMAYDLAKSRNEEAFPMTIFNAIDAGENPIRVFRNYRKLSGRTLAEMSYISEAYLSQIESGARKGTSKTLKAIAKALKVDLDDIA